MSMQKRMIRKTICVTIMTLCLGQVFAQQQPRKYVFPSPPAGSAALDLARTLQQVSTLTSASRSIMHKLLPSPDGKRKAIEFQRDVNSIAACVWDEDSDHWSAWPPRPYERFEQIYQLEWSPSGKVLGGRSKVEKNPETVDDTILLQDVGSGKLYRLATTGLFTFVADDRVLLVQDSRVASSLFPVSEVTLSDSGPSVPRLVGEISLPKGETPVEVAYSSGRLWVHALSSSDQGISTTSPLYSYSLAKKTLNKVGECSLGADGIVLAPDRSALLVPDSGGSSILVKPAGDDRVSTKPLSGSAISWWDNDTLVMDTMRQREYVVPAGESLPKDQTVGYLVNESWGPAISRTKIPASMR